MSKHRRVKGSSKKAHRRQNVRWLVSITSVLILVLAGWIWLDSTEEDNDLSAIGKGENVVVQALKRVVNSLQPEYKGKIRFLVANLNSKEGRWFAEYHNVSRVTLLFFKPDGTKISTLNGEQQPDFLRRVFDRVFKLE